MWWTSPKRALHKSHGRHAQNNPRQTRTELPMQSMIAPTEVCGQKPTTQDNEKYTSWSGEVEDSPVVYLNTACSQNRVNQRHPTNLLRTYASRIRQVLAPAHRPRRSQSQSRARSLEGVRSLGARGRIVRRHPRRDQRAENIQA